MVKRAVNKKQSKKEDDEKFFAFLAVFFSIFGFIIALLAKKDNKYVMFYAKQSLILFLVLIGVKILGMIPFIGWFIIRPIGYIFVFVLWIIQIVYSISGEQKETPLIGKFARNINL